MLKRILFAALLLPCATLAQDKPLQIIANGQFSGLGESAITLTDGPRGDPMVYVDMDGQVHVVGALPSGSAFFFIDNTHDGKPLPDVMVGGCVHPNWVADHPGAVLHGTKIDEVCANPDKTDLITQSEFHK